MGGLEVLSRTNELRRRVCIDIGRALLPKIFQESSMGVIGRLRLQSKPILIIRKPIDNNEGIALTC